MKSVCRLQKTIYRTLALVLAILTLTWLPKVPVKADPATEDLIALGNEAYEQKEYLRALDYHQAAFREMDSTSDGYVELLMLLMADSYYAGTDFYTEQYITALEALGLEEDGNLLFYKACTYMNLGKYAQAASIFEDILLLYPYESNIVLIRPLQAKCKVMLGKFDAALADYQLTIFLGENPDPGAYARALASVGYYEACVEEIEALGDTYYSEDYEIAYFTAWYALGRFDELRTRYEEMRIEDPSNALATYYLAVLLGTVYGEYNEADALFDELEQSNPEWSSVVANRASMAALQGKFDEELEYLKLYNTKAYINALRDVTAEEAQALLTENGYNPSSEELQGMLVASLTFEEMTETSLASFGGYFENLVQNYPENVTLAMTYAEILKLLGRNEDAITVLKQARTNTSWFKSAIDTEMAYCYRNAGDYAKFRETFPDIDNRESLLAVDALFNSYLYEGDYENADVLLESIEVSGSLRDSTLMHAILYGRLTHDYELMLIKCEEYLTIHPNAQRALAYKIYALWMMGNETEAEELVATLDRYYPATISRDSLVTAMLLGREKTAAWIYDEMRTRYPYTAYRCTFDYELAPLTGLMQACADGTLEEYFANPEPPVEGDEEPGPSFSDPIDPEGSASGTATSKPESGKPATKKSKVGHFVIPVCIGIVALGAFLLVEVLRLRGKRQNDKKQKDKKHTLSREEFLEELEQSEEDEIEIEDLDQENFDSEDSEKE